jgi:hypothetical protein
VREIHVRSSNVLNRYKLGNETVENFVTWKKSSTEPTGLGLWRSKLK